MNHSEESLVTEGLSHYEAKIVVYLAHHKTAGVKALSQTIQASVERCLAILESLRGRGILTRKKTGNGDQYSLGTFLASAPVEDKKHPSGKPYFPPFMATKISRVIKPASE